MNKTLVNEIESRRAGVYTRMQYKVSMDSKLSASSKKSGYKVDKITETTCRVGCNYNHMASVIRKRENGEISTAKTNPYEWVSNNRIKRHVEKGTEYLVIGTVPKANSKSMYVIYHGMDKPIITDKLNDEQWELFQQSARPDKGKKHEVPEVLSIKLENVMKFNGVMA